ncbi:MAG: 16S rRNA (uracil(1498)-N(3))-methyltransferase [Verrucomicrobia bacterium]|nr:16S rRNA (uracil(1498)-N(3))-methyltransferase [Verrucomicrobiota bacterium]
MHRFFIAGVAPDSTELCLEGSEAHHALNVLRVETNSPVSVLDGAGSEYLCTVKDVRRNSVALAVLERRQFTQPHYPVTLFQAVVKNKAMDLIIQKTTELGVHKIVPVICERSVVRPSSADAAEKVAKWRAVAIEAIKQCGQPWLPLIDEPRPLAHVLREQQAAGLSIVASLQHGAKHPRECFMAHLAVHRSPPKTVSVWIGPEGDFTKDELAAILASGAVPVTLGPHVLRSETAAICSVAISMYELTFGAK